MKYVFDTNSLSNILNHYFMESFPSFWEKMNQIIEDGKVMSVREAKFELKEKFNDNFIQYFTEPNPDFFDDPTVEELEFIREIYQMEHFQQNLDRKKLLKGGYFADPFVIAKAKTNGATVVTEEDFKVHGVRIPNICSHFGIECMKLEDFFNRENWKF